ncbi:MAG: AAA family ATPase [Deltaproteobacteria bacterium]|nr:AAA family ATPase [Deltaproteobacteria bacterium]
MRIDKLTLSNYRAFEKFEVNFHPELTVLIGENGAGKSTILEGLAVALGAWLGGFASLREDFSIPTDCPRRVLLESDGLATTEVRYPVRVEACGEVRGQLIEWARELRHSKGRTTRGEAASIRTLARTVEEDLTQNGVELPVISCYGTGRLWLQRRDKKRKQEQLASRLMGYTSALDAASDPKHFEAWMRWRTENALLRMARAQAAGKPMDDVESPHLDAVEAAACACLPGAKRFYFSIYHQDLRIERADGVDIPFRSLSDGQRNIVAVAADIAWRAAQLNPQYGRDAAERIAGIVLIDEVELHLHPQWQRSVVGDLRRTFPRVQFVMTTHSPQVVSTIPRESVRVLHGDDAPLSAGHVEGRDSNTILERTFDVSARPVETQHRLDELASLIDDEDLTSARAMLETLRTRLGDDDPDVVAAAWEIRATAGDHVAD